MKWKISEELRGGSRHLYLVREIRLGKVPGLKVGNSRECSGATLDPRGGCPVEGRRNICMEGGVTHSGLAVVNPLLRVSGRTDYPNCEP